MRWPTDEARIGQGLAERERERERRAATYVVMQRYGDDRTPLSFVVTPDRLRAFEVGTKHQLRIKDDRVIVDGKLVEKR